MTSSSSPGSTGEPTRLKHVRRISPRPVDGPVEPGHDKKDMAGDGT